MKVFVVSQIEYNMSEHSKIECILPSYQQDKLSFRLDVKKAAEDYEKLIYSFVSQNAEAERLFNNRESAGEAISSITNVTSSESDLSLAMVLATTKDQPVISLNSIRFVLTENRVTPLIVCIELSAVEVKE